MSTLEFYTELANISLALANVPNKLEVLKRELIKVNRKLPASVYIPFVKSQTRSCAILHIPVSEAKVFVTKERAPFLVCIEIYRPYDELKMLQNDLKATERIVSRSASTPEAYKPVRRLSNVTMNADLDDSEIITARLSVNLGISQLAPKLKPKRPFNKEEYQQESGNQAKKNPFKPATSPAKDTLETYEDEDIYAVAEETKIPKQIHMNAPPPESEHPPTEHLGEFHYQKNSLLNTVSVSSTPR
jgi:hypothetical protein